MTALPDPAPDRPDVIGTDDAVEADARRLVAETEAQLRAIEGALERLDSGSYGTCVRCRAPIEPERLQARPSEPYCAAHAAEIT